MFIGHIIDGIAKRRDHRRQQLLNHQYMIEKTWLEKQEEEHSVLASQVFMRFIQECQTGDIAHVGIEDEGGFRFSVGIWSVRKGSEREVRIEISNLRFGKTYLVIYTRRAIRGYEGWWANYCPL